MRCKKHVRKRRGLVRVTPLYPTMRPGYDFSLMPELRQKEAEVEELRRKIERVISEAERDAVEELRREIERVKAERDAAVSDLESACSRLPSGEACHYCRHYPCPDDMDIECEEDFQWAWRGQQTAEGASGEN